MLRIFRRVTADRIFYHHHHLHTPFFSYVSYSFDSFLWFVWIPSLPPTSPHVHSIRMLQSGILAERKPIIILGKKENRAQWHGIYCFSYPISMYSLADFRFELKFFFRGKSDSAFFHIKTKLMCANHTVGILWQYSFDNMWQTNHSALRNGEICLSSYTHFQSDLNFSLVNLSHFVVVGFGHRANSSI